MNYTAEKHFVSPHDTLLGNADDGGAQWDAGGESSMARHDTWLLSFVDILALLLTLFVLLLAFQDSETEPADTVAATTAEFLTDNLTMPLDALDLLVQQPLTVPTGAPMPDGYAMPGEGLLPVETSPALPETEIAETAEPAMPPMEEPLADVVLNDPVPQDGLTWHEEESPEIPVQALSGTHVAPHESEGPVEALLEVLEDSNLHDRVEVTVHPGEVNMEISDSILFSRASAVLTDGGRVLLKDLADALGGQPYTLSVEGHTDNIPIKTTRYPSNWELSSARAAVVTRELIEHGIVPDKVRAIGYGSTRPLAENDSPEGRARNRRVSFILQVDVQEDSQEH